MKKEVRRISRAFSHFVRYFQLYWYFGTTIFFTTYIVCNWTRVTDFVFFSKFDGKNLVFIVWILLILLPIVNRFEGFGFKVKSLFADPLNKKANELILQSSKETYTTQDSVEEVEKKLAALPEGVDDSDEV